jgi:predicted HAD superfamily Cof-like phosphohydrolase
MDKNQDRVRKFMQMFGQETPERPTQLDENTAKLRAALILEECLETIMQGLGLAIKVEFNDGREFCLARNVEDQTERYGEYFFKFIKEKEVDLVELVDGIGDIMVVTVGTSIACGIDQEPVNEEILNSNDSKMWKREDLDKVPPNCTVEEVGNEGSERNGGDRVYRVKRGDGKVIKSPSYFPAQIASIIEEQKNRSEVREISSETLNMIERSMEEFKKGKVLGPINNE